MKLKSALGGLAALGLVMSAGVASAETWPATTFNEMVNEASTCVKARVLRSDVRRLNGAVYTLTTFEIQETAFGQGFTRISVRTEGGSFESGGFQLSEVGSHGVRFFADQEVVMFLDRFRNTRTFTPALGGQGIFTIRDGEVQLPILGNEPVEVGVALNKIADLRRQNAKNAAQ